ncbi:type IV secretory pathway TrbL component [Microbacterium sp. SORGH_AS428]|uniref:hypothetical protein n=1 Tax=Microbacterium sp. SORGH_AS_0428 TaxID=3041788 RepID=UPI002866236C|nr:hypothetical protein [Microbacterium sp. SORGH_AS_0428]MDR6200778.1 type IV secretory pathway TrbL component [Microbacterium sp. SORGH_AS_0428]
MTIRSQISKLARVAIVSALLTTMAVGGSVAATADEVNTSGTQSGKSIVYWGDPRYNSRQANGMQARSISTSGWGGAWTAFAVGARNGSSSGATQIARADLTNSVNQGIWRTFTRPNGSSEIPQGNFWITTRLETLCIQGVDCPGTQQVTFSIGLRWNL